MKRLAIMAAATALATLAACDDGSAPQNVTKITVGDSAATVGKLRGLSQQNRDLALRRAIQDGGQHCKRIQSSREVGDYKGMSMWTAHCEENTDWAVFIAATGDIQVRSCGHVAQLGLPTCETGKPAEGGAPAKP